LYALLESKKFVTFVSQMRRFGVFKRCKPEHIYLKNDRIIITKSITVVNN